MRALEKGLIWFVTAVVAAPFFLPGWLPLTDLPEHAAAMTSIARLGEPAYRIDEHYRIAWTTSQYLLLHFAGAGLVKLLGSAEIACRILLVGLATAWVQTSRYLLRVFGADERLAVMSALLFWNRALIVGFLPYVASLPLLFYTLALFVDRASWKERLPQLAGMAIVVFYTHASAFTLLAAISAALVVRTGLLEAVRRLVWLGPAAVLAAIWMLRAPHDAVGTMAPLRAVKLIALYAHDIWPNHVDDWIGASFWILFLVLLVLNGRERRASFVRFMPFVAAFVMYLVTPFRVGTGVLLNVRLAPILACFALLALRRIEGVRGTLPILVAAALSVVQCVDNVMQFRRLQTDVVGVRELLAELPRGSRLITLNFSGFDPYAAHFTPWLHVGSHHRAMNGGVASFSFSELPHWSIQYRQESEPPRQAELSWGMRPCLYRNDRDGPYFDFVLTRGALNPFKDEPPGPRWKVRGRTAKYTLYEKDRSSPPVPGEDRGPCENL